MADSKASNTSEAGSRLVDRFIRVLKAFTQLGGAVHGTGEIARAAKLDDSTTSRILQSGVYGGFFERMGHGKYRLGVGAALLGIHALAHAPATDENTHRILEDVREATGGGLVFQYMLTTIGGARRQCIDRAVGDSADLKELGMAALEALSVTNSLRVGASGRTILAHLPGSIQALVLAEAVPVEAGPGAYRDDEELLASLADIRNRGFALGYEECMPLWNSCAAPIVWCGTVVGALLVLKPAAVMPEVTKPIIEATKAAAATLSAKLGHAPVPSS
ncbi:IclR family transcriptional regulator C-terminal domain-containing protein [Streptomyces chartreusis]|uniref:IclR family transcriptional regulator n=1 Tax=Streptomyces chartreusis TaxID=1969 RepID=UPI0033D1B50F